MRILVVGAYGFIGSAVVARLAADGHEVVGAGRRIRRAARMRPDLCWTKFDFARQRKPEQWRALLQDVDAVVNCAGVPQDRPGGSTRMVHVAGAAALFEACAREGVRRVVHVSTAGVAADAGTRFSRTRFAAEQALQRQDLDWVIVRPSLVIGTQVHGGMAFVRALAAIPYVLPIARESASFQPVQLGELAAAIAFLVRAESPARRVFEIAGPERLSLLRIIALYRRWLGLAPARVIRLPTMIARIAAWAGDVVSWLGWRPPLRSTALRELISARAENPDEWVSVTGIQPLRLETALRLEPASAAERWFARLYLLKPLIVATLALFWIVSGAIGLGPARAIVADLLEEVGFDAWSHVAVIVSGAIHLMVGVGIAIRATARSALVASLVVAVVYVAAGSLMRIGLWFDPLGALIKMFPLIVLTLVALAVLDDR